MSYDYKAIMAIYEGSNGDATKAMYQYLEGLGPKGIICVNLFRAHKTSSRAKVYRGRYKGAGYDTKQWSLDNLEKMLRQHGETLGIKWGWAKDKNVHELHSDVLYVDLPTGQVSWHNAVNGKERLPAYPGKWDGVRGEGPRRIAKFIEQVIMEETANG